MTKLVIDYGNTIVKAAVFSGNEMLERISFSGKSPEKIISLLSGHSEINKVIICSVSDDSSDIADYLKEKTESFFILGPATALPFRNMYRSKESLGYDRIAAAAGAYTIFPESDVLIIDAGTAITYDFLSSLGEYTGGNISPGKSMRARALHQFTSRLPLVDPDGEPELLADNTHDALKAGIINGILFEMQGYIERLKEKHNDLKIILTGGDAKYFDNKLKYSIFVDSNINLVGLNCILEYNVNKK